MILKDSIGLGEHMRVEGLDLERLVEEEEHRAAARTPRPATSRPARDERSA